MDSSHWFLSNSTDLTQIAVEGRALPLEKIVESVPDRLVFSRPYNEARAIAIKGFMTLNKRKGLCIIRQSERTSIECLGYKNLAFQLLIMVCNSAKFESTPMSEENMYRLQEEFFNRAYDYANREGLFGERTALELFEQPIRELEDELLEEYVLETITMRHMDYVL